MNDADNLKVREERKRKSWQRFRRCPSKGNINHDANPRIY